MIRSLHEFIDRLSELSPDIDGMDFKTKLSDRTLPKPMINFANQPQALQQLAMTVFTLTRDLGLPLDKMEEVLGRLLAEPTFYGAYHELGVYRWLNYNGVYYVPQPSVSQTAVLSQTGPVQLDGHFEDADVYFDIKSFGFQYNLKEEFRTRLQGDLGHGVTIDGPMDHALRDITAAALEDTEYYNKLVEALRNSGNGEISSLNWNIRLHKGHVNFEATTENPYRLAKENRYYPFNYAKQFTCNSPFLLIFAFDHLFNMPLQVDFANHTSILFRSLCRRAFVQFKAETRAISTIGKGYASKIDGATPLNNVAELLSAILFVDIQKKRSWLYTNPNAKNCLSRNRVHEIFGFDHLFEMEIEDFEYDNY